jgi:hypothetical protein
VAIFISNRMNLWISEHYALPPQIISTAVGSLPGDLYIFNFSIAISLSEELDSGAIGSDVCISVCPT